MYIGTLAKKLCVYKYDIYFLLITNALHGVSCHVWQSSGASFFQENLFEYFYIGSIWISSPLKIAIHGMKDRVVCL